MKRKYSKLISGLLAIMLLTVVVLPNIVMAEEDSVINSGDEVETEGCEVSITVEPMREGQPEQIVVESGEGTRNNPTVTTTTTVEEDHINNETTTTTTKDKEWKEENIQGNENSQSVETVDEYGQLLNATGESHGEETTVVKDENDTVQELEEEVEIENGEAVTEDGKKIEVEEPAVTVELQPGETKEKTEQMDAFFDDDTLDIPEWIRQKEGETVTWTTENSSKEEEGSITNITVEKAENTTTYTRKITTPDGKVTEEKIIYTRDEKGRITGYETETKEIVSETTEELTPPENAEIHADGGWKELVYEMPEKPVVEEAERDEEGNVINGKVVAEIHDNSGRALGYTTVEIVGGKIVKYSDPVMGKLVCRETKVETLENGLKKYIVTKTALTRTSGQKSSGDLNNGERTLTAKMGKINGNVVFDNTSLKTFLPDFTIAGPDGEGFNREKHIAKTNSIFLENYKEDGKYFQWLGDFGLYSLIYIRDGDGDIVEANQFEIKGRDGRKYYAYCADLGVYAQDGSEYNMQRLEETDYIEHKDKIRSIALKGYWGVKNESEDSEHPTAGSMVAFKKMLLDNNALTEDESDKLTEGMALLATQAAIWRYGNSGQNKLGEELQIPWGLGDAQKSIINKTYKYLIGMEGTPAAASNTIFKKDDFAKMVDLTVKEKLEGDKYNTDVKIAMAVDFDENDGDLKLYVTADGEKVDEFRLTGSLQEGEKFATKNADGTYTLSGLHLKGDTKFNINLKGIQNLRNGVYIFSCMKGPDGSPAQTLIGAGEAQQDIDLNVDFKFNVKEKVTYTSAKSESEVETLEWEGYYYTFEETENFEDEVWPDTTDNDELIIP